MKKPDQGQTWVLIGYSALSAIMVIVSLFVFNGIVFLLDVAVYALAVLLILALKMDLISVKFGVFSIPHFLLPCVLWYNAEMYYVVRSRLVIYTGIIASLTILIFFVTRFWKEVRISRGLITLVIFGMMFLTATSSITLANALFDTSQKVVHSCRITDMDFMWGDKASVTIESFYGDERKFDLMLDESYARDLSVGDTIDVTVGNGFLGLDFFTVN